MFKLRSIRVTTVLYTLFVMLLSGLLTSFSIMLLRFAGLLPSFIYATVWMPFITVFASIVIGSVIAAYMSQRLLQPLRRLIEATGKVARGNFEVQLDEGQGEGDVGELISSFNLMVQELKGIEMFRSDFINTFSHEFKTPIVSIRGFARQLQREDLSPEQRKEYTDIIVSESERLARLSANVLLLTKLENQSIVTGVQEFSLDEQLRDSILLLEKQWEEKEIELDIRLQPIRYTGSAEMLSEVWVNLLNNAIKFTDRGGKIYVSCAEYLNGVMVKVQDNGIGMDEETKKRIFGKFYQGDPSHTQQGNGLGLAVAQRIVDLCKGNIHVESALGEGTTFTVFLPKEERNTIEEASH